MPNRKRIADRLPELLHREQGALATESFDRFRFNNYTVLVLLGLPIMLTAVGYHSAQRNYALLSLILLSASGLTGGWLLALRRTRRDWIYNLNILFFAILLCYLLVIGGNGGSKTLWIYTFPLICHLFLGKRPGMLWNGGLILLIALIFYLPLGGLQVFPYDADFKLRFLASYLTLSLFALRFESLLHSYRTEMQGQNSELQEAISQVKTLQGLLPICSYCHKIADEKGSWDHLEGYIQKHSEAQFTHGICPECASEHFPESKAAKKAAT